MPVSKINAAAVVEPQILSRRIVWNTIRDFMICQQDNNGNLMVTPASYNLFPDEASNNKLFDEESSNWIGTYYTPLISGNITQITADPSTLLSPLPNEFNGIPFARVFKSVIIKVSKPIDGTSCILLLNQQSGDSIKILNSLYYKSSLPGIYSDYIYRLRPRIPITAAEYADLITSWDSSSDINKNIAQKLDYISHNRIFNPNMEFNYPVLPKSYYLPLCPGLSVDSNYPYVIVPTMSTIEIDYYWR